MRLLTKAEACRELEVSLSTLNRRIMAGEVPTQREPCGRRHRVYVMLDDEPPQHEGNVASGDVALAVAYERIRGLEEQLDFLQEQLELEQHRNADLVDDLKALASPEQGRPWWRFRQRKGTEHMARTLPHVRTVPKEVYD